MKSNRNNKQQPIEFKLPLQDDCYINPDTKRVLENSQSLADFLKEVGHFSFGMKFINLVLSLDVILDELLVEFRIDGKPLQYLGQDVNRVDSRFQKTVDPRDRKILLTFYPTEISENPMVGFQISFDN